MVFEDLVGQKHVARTLGKAIETGRVAHAFLFTGTRGVGKTTTARLLAMALNCGKGPTAKPCGKCGPCREIKAGIGLDVLEIDGASNRGIDDIRELREQIAYTPAGGKHRIVIIDEVHMLTAPAFNALLKSLEEPPPNFIFIFATTEPHKVPETILSRVQRYDFKRISPADIAARLKHICDTEKIAYDDDGLLFIARKANGSMRDALTLLDQIIPFCEEKITLNGARSVLGLVETDLYLKLFDMVLAKDETGAINLVAGLFSEGADLAEFTFGMEEHVRHVLMAGLPGVQGEALGLSADEQEKYRAQAGKFDRVDLLRMLEILSGLSYRVSRSPMPRYDVETALLKLCRMDRAIDITRFLSTETGAPPEKKNESPVLTAAPPAPEPQAAPRAAAPAPAGGPAEPPPRTDMTALKDKWKDILRVIIADSMQVGTFLTYSFVISADAKQIRLGLPKSQKFQLDQLSRPEHMQWMRDYFRQRHGFDGRISLEAVEDEKSADRIQADLPRFEKKDIQGAAKKRENLNDVLAREPILGDVLKVFNGEIRET
jgi:DNA polymerase-3 subunit gamma/tau